MFQLYFFTVWFCVLYDPYPDNLSTSFQNFIPAFLTFKSDDFSWAPLGLSIPHKVSPEFPGLVPDPLGFL